MSASPQKYVVVLGASGIGKSYFIDSQVRETVPHRDGGTHVTRETKSYQSLHDPSISFMDTLGTNVDKVPPLEKLRGKTVCFVVILSSGRVEDERAEIQKWTGDAPCFFYWKRENLESQAPPQDLRSIHSFRLDDLSYAVFPSISHVATAHSPPSAAAALSVATMTPERVFPHMGDGERAVLKLYENGHLALSKQKEPNLKLITDAELVRKFRLRGETILKYYLQCMDLPQQQVDGLIGNERLSELLTIWGLDEHHSHLYPGADTLNHETRADYVEALFGYVVEKEKRMLGCLLVKIITG